MRNTPISCTSYCWNKHNQSSSGALAGCTHTSTTTNPTAQWRRPQGMHRPPPALSSQVCKHSVVTVYQHQPCTPQLHPLPGRDHQHRVVLLNHPYRPRSFPRCCKFTRPSIGCSHRCMDMDCTQLNIVHLRSIPNVMHNPLQECVSRLPFCSPWLLTLHQTHPSAQPAAPPVDRAGHLPSHLPNSGVNL